jgi:DNA segregation ATPase FtsK/SpoIIIE-like protein
MTSFPIADDITINLRGQSGCEVVGRPGSGKSMLASYIMLIAMKLGAFPVFADTKRSDFFQLGKMLSRSELDEKSVPRSAATPAQVAGLLRKLNSLMNQRYEKHNAWGKDWVDFRLRPVVLILDEYSATIAEADKSTVNEIDNYMKQLVFKSRQMGGIFTVLCSQRLNSNVLDVNVSAEFATRIAMENLDSVSLRLAFPQCDLDQIPVVPNIPGHGLIYSDSFSNNLPQQFVAPNLSEVDVPMVARLLDERNHSRKFAHEDYWPF